MVLLIGLSSYFKEQLKNTIMAIIWWTARKYQLCQSVSHFQVTLDAALFLVFSLIMIPTKWNYFAEKRHTNSMIIALASSAWECRFILLS